MCVFVGGAAGASQRFWAWGQCDDVQHGEDAVCDHCGKVGTVKHGAEP